MTMPTTVTDRTAAAGPTTKPMTGPLWRLMPLVPLVFAVVAWLQNTVFHVDNTFFREGVAGVAALICVTLVWLAPRSRDLAGRRWLWALVVAFAMSMIGDLFLNNHTGNWGFIAGIFFFLLAHLGFWAYAASRVKFSWPILIVIAVALLALYFLVFLPSPGLSGNHALAIAVLAYLLVSCCSLTASIDRQSRSAARWVYTAGIFSLVISDALIAFNEFVGNQAVAPAIMPLYYLCHILVAWSVTLEFARR